MNVPNYAQTDDGKHEPCFCFIGGYCDYHEGPCYYPPRGLRESAVRCAAEYNEGPDAKIPGQFPND